jgi:hypothetical protein
MMIMDIPWWTVKVKLVTILLAFLCFTFWDTEWVNSTTQLDDDGLDDQMTQEGNKQSGTTIF